MVYCTDKIVKVNQGHEYLLWFIQNYVTAEVNAPYHYQLLSLIFFYYLDFNLLTDREIITLKLWFWNILIRQNKCNVTENASNDEHMSNFMTSLFKWLLYASF